MYTVLVAWIHFLQWEGGREKKVLDKRVRMEKEPLENLLFRLFEKQVSFLLCKAFVCFHEQYGAAPEEALKDVCYAYLVACAIDEGWKR